MSLSAATPVRAALVCVLLTIGAFAAGCASQHPPPLDARSLEDTQTFPYYRVYWAGRVFDQIPLTAADGRTGFNHSSESVYYGDCDRGSGLSGSGSCVLPLQVTTALYSYHTNIQLGTQRNTIVRGVPATIFDGGKSIELYSGRVVIDVFADKPERAVRAAQALRPINAGGSAATSLPLPTYTPGLVGPAPTGVTGLIDRSGRRPASGRPLLSP